MAECAIELFCEDSGHELFARALVSRHATEAGVRIHVAVRSARGGHGRASSELATWLRAPLRPDSDLLIVLIDANGTGWNERRGEILKVLREASPPLIVIGCPEPHIEAWLLSSPQSFSGSVGITWDGVAPRDGNWKRLLDALVADSGVPVLGSPMQLAFDIVPKLDLYDAGKRSPSLKHFIDELRGALARVRG